MTDETTLEASKQDKAICVCGHSLTKHIGHGPWHGVCDACACHQFVGESCDETGTTLEALIERIENYYGFECEGGPLKLCTEWQELKAKAVRAHAEGARQALEQAAADCEKWDHWDAFAAWLRERAQTEGRTK